MPLSRDSLRGKQRFELKLFGLHLIDGAINHLRISGIIESIPSYGKLGKDLFHLFLWAKGKGDSSLHFFSSSFFAM